jgi:hypothetical protein
MKSVSAFIEDIGRNKFAAETGYAQQVISRAISDNVMPPGWFLDVRDKVCANSGVAVPEHLFRWVDKRKSPELAPIADD